MLKYNNIYNLLQLGVHGGHCEELANSTKTQPSSTGSCTKTSAAFDRGLKLTLNGKGCLMPTPSVSKSSRSCRV